MESTRASVFIDGGNVYNTYQSIDLGMLRYSVGVSVQWLSPLGPIVFSLAKPLHTFEGDITEPFQFNIGSLF
jgi:outer membrane protein insertion porin family